MNSVLFLSDQNTWFSAEIHRGIVSFRGFKRSVTSPTKPGAEPSDQWWNPYLVGFTTWWLIPLSKWIITPVINGISRVNPLITGVIIHLLSGMSHQVGFTTGWGPQSIAFSWFITPITMVYDTQITIFGWGFKPTYNWRAPSCRIRLIN